MVALNFTLDRMSLETKVCKQSGAKCREIRPSKYDRNLRDNMKLNSHSLYEIVLDNSDLLVKGSAQFITDMENIITSYDLSVDTRIKYKDIYDLALLNSTFKANLVDDSTLLNELYSAIWTNDSLNSTEKT